MKLLAIDSSGACASCAVLCDDRIASDFTISNGLVHSRSLLPLTEQALRFAETEIGEIDCFACVAGPGSFTGVRMGVCAVKGLAMVRNTPCVAVNTLAAMAFGLAEQTFVCPMLDARRGQVYTALYAPGGGEMIPPSALPLEELINQLQDKQVLFCGDGADAFQEVLQKALGDHAYFAPPHLNYPRAAAAAVLAKQEFLAGRTVTPAALDAIYLRKPQAEREYDSHSAV